MTKLNRQAENLAKNVHLLLTTTDFSEVAAERALVYVKDLLGQPPKHPISIETLKTCHRKIERFGRSL